MSRLIKNTASLLLCAVMAVTASFGALAYESTPDNAEPEADKIVVTGEEIENSSFSTAVQNALNKARDNSADGRNTVVKVEPGYYELTKGLRIFSNTTLSLYDVTIKRAQYVFVNMIRTGNEDSASKGVTGYHYENILIEGGVFDAAMTVQTMIKAAHAKNFRMKDVSLLNVKNSHMMEVAGVDGLTLENCELKNQIIDIPEGGELCYEALQLDVLKAGHIVNCRSEDLPIKNVIIQGCTFENLPRAVGSHTAILNNPLRNITINNNTFTNMGSAAVQTLGWVNCKITGNYIEKTPRAIALYSAALEGRGTYLPEVLESEGGVESSTENGYKTPEDSKTVISDNIIKDCSSVEDVYGNYKMSAISAMGYDINTVYERGKDDSAGLPAGNYFFNGLTLKNNYIEVQGTGCRIENVKKAEVVSNSIICKKSELYPDNNYYGVVVRTNSELSSVSNNYIQNAETSGIHIGERCSVDSIAYNRVDKASLYGIVAYRSTLREVIENNVSSANKCGIAFKTNTDVISPISGNRVLSCPTGMQLTLYSNGYLNCNTIVKCDNPISYDKVNLRDVIGNNYTKFSDTDSVIIDVNRLELPTGKNYKLKTTAAPLNSDSKFIFSSSDSSVASVDESGFIRALKAGEAKITAKSSNGKEAVVSVLVSDSISDTKTNCEQFTKISTAHNNDKAVKITWNRINSAAKYRVFRKKGNSWAKIADTTSLSYSDKKVSSGNSYTYTVRALNSKGTYTSAYDKTGVTLKYACVTALKLLYNTKDDIIMKWDKVPGACRYRIFYKTKDTSWTRFVLAKNNTRHFRIGTPGNDYSFIIIGVDELGYPVNTYKKSGYSIKRLTKPDLKLEKSDKEGKKVKLSWSAVKGAGKYELKVLEPKKKYIKTKVKKKLKNKKTKTVVKATTVVYYKWRGLSTKNTAMIYKGNPGMSYSFTLTAYDAKGKSSSEISDKKSYSFPKEIVKKTKKKTKNTSKKTTKKTTAKKKN